MFIVEFKHILSNLLNTTFALRTSVIICRSICILHCNFKRLYLFGFLRLTLQCFHAISAEIRYNNIIKLHEYAIIWNICVYCVIQKIKLSFACVPVISSGVVVVNKQMGSHLGRHVVDDTSMWRERSSADSDTWTRRLTFDNANKCTSCIIQLSGRCWKIQISSRADTIRMYVCK